MVEKSDPDGLDVYTTMPFSKNHRKSSAALASHLKKVPRCGVSNIQTALTTILTQYTHDHSLQHQKNRSKVVHSLLKRIKGVRPMTVYVFTNAKWQDGCDPSRPIIDTLNTLNSAGVDPDDNQIGVQFIQCGNDPLGTRKLQYLDNELKAKFGRDIVDTEPMSGNAWKMFLGSINPVFDEAG